MQTTPHIRPHNEKAATLWSSGGETYDLVSQGISAGILHSVDRLGPGDDEQIIDIGTGTGLAARELARRGANVTGVDIADGMLAAARAIAQDHGLDIEFRTGDAEALPFDDGAFDAAISTYGIMFSADPKKAASELARVVKPGGRVAIAAWTPDSNAMAMREVLMAYAPPPDPAPPPPARWGTEEGTREYLGEHFELRHEKGRLHIRFPDGETAWQVYSEGFGPAKMVAKSLEPGRRQQLADEFIAFWESFPTDLGVAVPTDYLMTLARRK